MLILAFDTTSEYGGAGLYSTQPNANSSTGLDRLSGASHEGGRPDYSVWLFEHVERMLAETGQTLAQVDMFVVANGPGSFTGVRIGVAAAQGWSQALDRPVGSVSTLEAMVEAAQPATSWAVPLLDARRNDLYMATYRKAGGHGLGWQEIRIDPLEDSVHTARIDHGRLLKGTELASFLSAFWRSANAENAGNPTVPGVTCVVRECDAAVLALQSSFSFQTGHCSKVNPDSPGGSEIRWHIVSGSLIDAIARIGLRHYEQGKLDSPAGLEACYVRRSDAEMHWREDR